MFNRIDGVENEVLLPYHVCTDEDYDQFYPILQNQIELIQLYRDG